MRPILFKNLFVAFLTGLLVIVGVYYALYLTGSPDTMQLNKFNNQNSFPVYTGTSSPRVSNATSESVLRQSDLQITSSIHTTSQTNSTFERRNLSSKSISLHAAPVVQTNPGRRIYTSTSPKTVVQSTSTEVYGTTHYSQSSVSLTYNSKSNISSMRAAALKSSPGSVSLPGNEEIAMADLSTSFSASDLTGEPVKQSILPGTGLNPTEEDAVPVPGGIIILIIFALFKYLTHDSNFRKFKIFTYFSKSN